MVVVKLFSLNSWFDILFEVIGSMALQLETELLLPGHFFIAPTKLWIFFIVVLGLSSSSDLYNHLFSPRKILELLLILNFLSSFPFYCFELSF